jgi:hypothetical protein
VLAPSAPAVRDAVLRVASSGLGTALVLATLAPTMRHAVPSVRASNRTWLLSRSLAPA